MTLDDETPSLFASRVERCLACGDILSQMGRPRHYCDATCRRVAEHERTRTPERLAAMREAKARQTQRAEAAMPGLWRKRRSRAISRGRRRRMAP